MLSAVVSLITLAAWRSPVAAQVSETDPRFSEGARVEYQRRDVLIKKELVTLKNHEWAGEHYYGDGLGVNVSLSLAPKSGFVFMWTGCLGVYDLNYGDVVWTGDSVRLIFQFPNERRGFQGMSLELIPVRWGRLHYLIPTDKMIDFCNAVNAGLEPPMIAKTKTGETFVMFGTRFLIRRGDEIRNTSGQPNIPSLYSDYLLKQPIRTVVTEVGKIRTEKESGLDATFRYTTVTLNVGEADGVKSGMEFYVYSPDNRDSAKITEVREHLSVAILEQMYFDKEDAVPVVGWRLSTRFSENQLSNEGK